MNNPSLFQFSYERKGLPMNDDAKEAALGLLGLSPTNFRTPILLPTHSVSTPTIPAKRKQTTLELEDLAFAAVAAGPSFFRNGTNVDNSIRCICGSTFDDGFSIACDVCERWCHAACFDIVEGEVPEEWRCWECKPRPVDRERAERLQRERMRLILEAQQQQLTRGELDKGKRKASPGVEKRQKRTNAAVVEGGKKRRRPSVVHPHLSNILNVTPDEDEHVDIDEPWAQSYVHITEDIIPNDEIRQKIRLQAHKWRGVTALTSSPPPHPASAVASPVRVSQNTPLPSTSVRSVDPHVATHRALSNSSNLDVRPPVYAVHTTSPIPSRSLITPYTSMLMPSSAYVSDSLNAYAHLGLPKPFVHLVGSPLHLALDSRMVGDESRFVRNGCKPNAALRPILCDHSEGSSQDSLKFGVFALRDLKENEEVVLGWEWDDGNAVHTLPALIESPHMFSIPHPQNYRPEEIQHLRNQFANILYALSSTFATCACGSRAKDCAFTLMAAFVDGSLPNTQTEMNSSASSSPRTPRCHPDLDLGPLIGRKRGFRTREAVQWSGGMGGLEVCDQDEDGDTPIVQSHGLPTLKTSPPYTTQNRSGSGVHKGKGKAADFDVDMLRDVATSGSMEVSVNSEAEQVSAGQTYATTSQSSNFSVYDLRPPDPPDEHMGGDAHIAPQVDDFETEVIEEKMPPKMRKKWIHRALDGLKEKLNSDIHGDSDMVGLGIRKQATQNIEDPEAEAPSSKAVDLGDIPISDAPHPPSVSPSTSFSRLSLFSPLAVALHQAKLEHHPELQQQHDRSLLPIDNNRPSPLQSVIPITRRQLDGFPLNEQLSVFPVSPVDEGPQRPESPPSDVASKEIGPEAPRPSSPTLVDEPFVPVASAASFGTNQVHSPADLPLSGTSPPTSRGHSPIPVTSQLDDFGSAMDVDGDDQHTLSKPVIHSLPPSSMTLIDSEASTPALHATAVHRSAPDSEASTPPAPILELVEASGRRRSSLSPIHIQTLLPDVPQPMGFSQDLTPLESQATSFGQDTPVPSAPQPLSQVEEVITVPTDHPILLHTPSRRLSPAPAPKVKISLKDFALRKKKQREVEEQFKKSQPQSPVVDRVNLGAEERAMELEEAGSRAEPANGLKVTATSTTPGAAIWPLAACEEPLDLLSGLHADDPTTPLMSTPVGYTEKENRQPNHSAGGTVSTTSNGTSRMVPELGIYPVALDEDAVSLGESSDDEHHAAATDPSHVQKDGHELCIATLDVFHQPSRSLSPHNLPSRPRQPVTLSRTNGSGLPPRPLLLPPRPPAASLPNTSYLTKQEHLEPAVPMVPRRHNPSTPDLMNYPPKPGVGPGSNPRPQIGGPLPSAPSRARPPVSRRYSHEDGEIELSLALPPKQSHYLPPKTVLIPTGPRALGGLPRPEHVPLSYRHAPSPSHPLTPNPSAPSGVYNRPSPVLRRNIYPPTPVFAVAPPTEPRALRAHIAAQRRDREEKAGGK